MSPDSVNDLIKSGYTRPHLAVGLRYTLTTKEAENLRIVETKVLGVGLVSWGVWNLGKLPKGILIIEKRKISSLFQTRDFPYGLKFCYLYFNIFIIIINFNDSDLVF